MRNLGHIISTIILGTFLSVAPVITGFIPAAEATVFDATNQPVLFQNIPACNAARDMSRMAITDGPASPAMGQIVTGGGGTSHDFLMCNGTASTPNWIVIAGGLGGGAVTTTQQNFVKAAPVTPNAANSSNLNYSSGCSGSPGAASATIGDTVHNCLMFDDHWTTTPTNTTAQSALNLSNWYAGYYRCNGGFDGVNAVCTMQELGVLNQSQGFGNSIDYPMSAWCYGSASGCHGEIMFSYPFGVQTNTANVTSNTASIASDGTLQLADGFYNNATAVADTRCVTNPNNLGAVDCSKVNWIGGGITTGGLAITDNQNNLPTNLNALLPANGGLIQARMKGDQGLNAGMYPIIECDVVDQFSGLHGDNMSVNYEFGYNYGGNVGVTGVQGVGQGINGVANQVGNHTVLTGDDGVGSGDVTNWHTYAIEWSGPATHTFNYYIDGVPVSAITHNEPNVPSTGWKGFTCGITTGAALSQQNSFHTQVNFSNPGGPYNWKISDVQVYKKPGT